MSKFILSLVGLVLVSSSLTGCGGDEERYEDIKKLRAFGASTLPVISEPSTEAAPRMLTITVFAAVPLGETVTAEPYDDERSPTLSLPVTITGGGTYTDYSTFRVFSVQATQAVPAAFIFDTPRGKQPFARLRYGIRLVSGSESENVVGNSLIYPAGSAELARVAPTVAITKPALVDVSGTEDLEGAVTDSAEENMRIGWFASDGEIKNRRAKITEWATPSAGPATLILTARGMKTGAFAFQVMDVNVQ